MSLDSSLPSPAPRTLLTEAPSVTYRDPYDYHPPKGDALSLILASPHSGRAYPPAFQSQLDVPLIDLRRTEDAFMDELIAPGRALGAGLLTARYARGFVDLNRDPLELDRRMFAGKPPRACGLPGPRVEAGLGCIPRIGARGADIYRSLLDPDEVEARLTDIHEAYHGCLSSELKRLRALHGAVWLIDCHSMPSRQPGKRPLSDIVIGDRYGASCSPRLVGLIERRFRKLGYSVSRNAPYAGGYTTLRYGRPGQAVHAVQIEIRRDLYMDETRVEPGTGFSRMQGDLAAVMADIVGHVRHMTRAHGAPA